MRKDPPTVSEVGAGTRSRRAKANEPAVAVELSSAANEPAAVTAPCTVAVPSTLVRTADHWPKSPDSKPSRKSDGDEVTVHVRCAGVGSTLPVASTAATSKTWSPGVSPAYAAGDVHGLNSEPSRLHRKPTALADEMNEKLAVLSCVAPAGP